MTKQLKNVIIIIEKGKEMITMREMQTMYILQNGNTQEYKIGITNNLNKRLATLQTGCPNELKVVKVFTHYNRRTIEKYERVLHRYFTMCGCRIRPNGEWYNLRKPDITYLCKPQTIAEQNELIAEMLKMMRGHRSIRKGVGQKKLTRSRINY